MEARWHQSGFFSALINLIIGIIGAGIFVWIESQFGLLNWVTLPVGFEILIAGWLWIYLDNMLFILCHIGLNGCGRCNSSHSDTQVEQQALDIILVIISLAS